MKKTQATNKQSLQFCRVVVLQLYSRDNFRSAETVKSTIPSRLSEVFRSAGKLVEDDSKGKTIQTSVLERNGARSEQGIDRVQESKKLT